MKFKNIQNLSVFKRKTYQEEQRTRSTKFRTVVASDKMTEGHLGVSECMVRFFLN